MVLSYFWQHIPFRSAFGPSGGGISVGSSDPEPKPLPRITVGEAQAAWQPGWNGDNPPPVSGWYETRCLAYSQRIAHYYWDAEEGIWRVGGPPESLPEDNGRAKMSGMAEYRGPVAYDAAWEF